MKSMMRPTETSVKSAIASHCELKIQEFAASIKRPRTADDFLRFCDVVLSYANYPDAFGTRDGNDRKLDSPLNSIGESTHPSATSDASSRSSSIGEADIYTGTDVEDYCDEDNWEQVTCWCGKPFAGRPMIECESCFVWIHLSCARVRKSNIPKHFKCAKCKPVSGRRKRVFSENSDLDLVSADRSEPSSPISGLNGGSGDMSSFRDRYQSSSPMNSFEFKESLSSTFTDVDDESSQYQVMNSGNTSALLSPMPRSRSEERLLSSSKKIQSRRSAPLPQHSLKKASQNTHSSGHPADNPLAVRLVANYSTNYLSD